jgi:GT2 family glycosyltransferase
MNNSDKIGVVTVTYNSGSVLEQFLHSVAAQTYGNFLLYAVDNASQDTTLTQLEASNDARLRVIPNSVNVGVAEGNNQGTRAALADGCDYVLYLNNDVEFEPETFAFLVAEINALSGDLLAPKILFDDRVHIWSAGGTFNPLKGYFGFPTGQGEIDHGQYETPMRIKNAPTCCLLVRRAVFDAIGMMDAKYFVYHDDSDFLLRAWRAGLTMFYTPRARIYHKASVLTGGSASPFSLRYSTRGHVYFMLKNLGVMRCLFYLPALQLRMVMKVLFRSISWGEFLIRQRAFFEGIAVWASRAASNTR